jgi:hypothetical protein
MRVERADFDDLVTLVSQAPPWEKDRPVGVRTMLRAIAESKPDAPDQILARWTWKLARAVRKQLDRKASQEFPDAKRLLGALANSRGHRHEENAAKLVNAALDMPKEVGAALLASAEGYTPRATQLLEAARERLGSIQEVAGWIADNLPQPKTGPPRTRRRRRRKRRGPEGQQAANTPGSAAETNGGGTEHAEQDGSHSGDEAGSGTDHGTDHAAQPSASSSSSSQRRRRRRTPRKPSEPGSVETAAGPTPAAVPEPPQPPPERAEDAA